MEIKLKHLTKAFPGDAKKNRPETIAVSDLNIDIHDGELLGLLGPSGCGKSTTLYMIAGLKQPTDGEIWFGDEEVTHLAPEKRGIGLVFQNYALYPHLSVYDNVAFPLTNMKTVAPAEETVLMNCDVETELLKNHLMRSSTLSRALSITTKFLRNLLSRPWSITSALSLLWQRSSLA